MIGAMKVFKKQASSNWNAMKSKMGYEPGSEIRKDSKKNRVLSNVRRDGTSALISDDDDSLEIKEQERYVALDCEMVGLGHAGKTSALARACLVDYNGKVLYDRFVRPKGYVTDFRTKYSGVRQSDLRKGEAVNFEDCQNDVARLMKGKVLVGHALKNDTDSLMLSHPRMHIRDTAQYRPLMRVIGGPDKVKYRPRALRDLAKQYLGITIQMGEHDPSVDARTAMSLYKKFRNEWEASLKARTQLARAKAVGGDTAEGGTIISSAKTTATQTAQVQSRAAGEGCAAQRARAIRVKKLAEANKTDFLSASSAVPASAVEKTTWAKNKIQRPEKEKRSAVVKPEELSKDAYAKKVKRSRVAYNLEGKEDIPAVELNLQKKIRRV